MTRGLTSAAVLLALGTACGKVPIHDVEAEFLRADTVWFSAEDTLFVFYEVEALQGIGDPSVIEITWNTDTERVDWTPLTEFSPVHEHVDVDCGANALCGSWSIDVPDAPRDVQLRLRFHRDGELALTPQTVFNSMGSGAPHRSRSMVVYGIFEEENEFIQWRGRHQFPTLRNEQATDLGLRRWFSVDQIQHGTGEARASSNVYNYGAACPSDAVATNLGPVETSERSIFHPEPLPISAGTSSEACAQATVSDARGTFTTTAFALKNPEVRPAFPELRSPVYEATRLDFFLTFCNREFSPEHEEMQRQRLLVEDLEPTCIDDWRSDGFVDRLVVLFRDAVQEARPDGEDMVLVIGLHQDDAAISRKVEAALAQVVPLEAERSTPRLAGAWVFDSNTRTIQDPSLTRNTLWCPANQPIGDGSNASQRTCATQPDFPLPTLGPLSFSFLQILPNRDQYLDFLDTYTANQAGTVTSLRTLVPEFATTSDHVDLGEFGAITFLNGESFSAAPSDAFSYCIQPEPLYAYLRSPILQNPEAQQLIGEACAEGALPEAVCSTAPLGLLPAEALPFWHENFQEEAYEVGLFWDFPFLIRMEYESVLAGAASGIGLSIPFGFASDSETYLGTPQWESEVLDLSRYLTQCTRFCDHPTFDNAGIYNITVDFRTNYANACYAPLHPVPGLASGFPRDP